MLITPVAAAKTTDVLRDKSVLFIGDSIAYGYMDAAEQPRAWALRMKKDYGMTAVNNGLNGHSLSDIRDYSAYGGADKRLHIKGFDANTYDFVILQGGINDIIGAESGKGHPCPGVAVPVGEISATRNPDDFDTATFAGGLERYFYEAKKRYPTAIIGYIITYQTPNSTWGGNTENSAPYWAMARSICDKWEIPYLDLYADEFSIDLLCVDSNICLPDSLHLNEDGYNLTAPFVAEWMASLLPRDGQPPLSSPNTTSTSTGTIVTTTRSPEVTAQNDATTAITTNEEISTSSRKDITRIKEAEGDADYTAPIAIMAIGGAVITVLVVAAVIRGDIR